MPKAEGKGGVLMGAARRGLLNKNMAWNGGNRGEPRLVAYALLPQAREHAVARALRGHPDSAGFREHYFDASHVLIAGICCWCVRSICSGVSDTQSAATA